MVSEVVLVDYSRDRHAVTRAAQWVFSLPARLDGVCPWVREEECSLLCQVICFFRWLAEWKRWVACLLPSNEVRGMRTEIGVQEAQLGVNSPINRSWMELRSLAVFVSVIVCGVILSVIGFLRHRRALRSTRLLTVMGLAQLLIVTIAGMTVTLTDFLCVISLMELVTLEMAVLLESFLEFFEMRRNRLVPVSIS
ncbi:hypothetical protein [Phytophthora infestans RNA virus 1]|uniref:hypothetical protein n=1 Tax=Phytophthora infestans RNA virus 1 TaxID=640897 RepID=UPI0001B5DB02|nr:hypothetical protein [Phytophthora infestans RNA virus 1]ACQ91604.1 unknown [Phytophthora infestans RNA virus 1]